MVRRNGVEIDDIASVLFSLTPDLRAVFPAHGARELGWTHVPMLHFTEVDVPGALGRCIRMLMHVNTAQGSRRSSTSISATPRSCGRIWSRQEAA